MFFGEKSVGEKKFFGEIIFFVIFFKLCAKKNSDNKYFGIKINWRRKKLVTKKIYDKKNLLNLFVVWSQFEFLSFVTI